MILRRKAARGENSYPRLFIFYKAGRGPSSAIKGAKKAKTATFPSTLRAVQKSAFGGSALLRSVVLNEGLEKLGRAFQGTHIDELTVPSTLREYSNQAFCDCDSLKLVWAEDTRTASLLPTGDRSARMSRQSIRFGNTPLLDLRLQREVVIPEGAERIGRRWFWGCAIESVVIPASVGAIEKEAFWE